MSAPLKALVDELEGMLPLFEARRNEDALANDCFEAAWYWRDLGRWVLEGNTRVNYPERAKGEFMLLTQLLRSGRQRWRGRLKELGHRCRRNLVTL